MLQTSVLEVQDLQDLLIFHSDPAVTTYTANVTKGDQTWLTRSHIQYTSDGTNIWIGDFLNLWLKCSTKITI